MLELLLNRLIEIGAYDGFVGTLLQLPFVSHAPGIERVVKYPPNIRVRTKVTRKEGIVIRILPDGQCQVFVSQHEVVIISENDLESIAVNFGFVTFSS